MSKIAGIDHVAITVEDLEATTDYYQGLFGAEVVAEHSVDGHVLVRQLSLGGANLSVHQKGNGVALVAARPTPGSADICFRWRGRIDEVVNHLHAHGVAPLEAPSPRSSASGEATLSVFFRDQSGNLIELMADP